MRVAICEDSAQDREALCALCLRYEQENGLPLSVEAFASGRAFMRSAFKDKCELLFLDIYMDGENGVDTAGELRRRGFTGALVFVTTSQDFYADGFAVNAQHYLVKPCVYTDFCEAVARAKRHLGLREGLPEIELLVDRLPVRLPIDSIRYFEVYNHTVYIHQGTHTLHASATLQQIEDQLDDARFLRCHRSYLVNMDYVDAFNEQSNTLVLKGESIPVSRRRTGEIKRRYIEYLSAVAQGNRP